jgi:hypothetical protein
MKPLSAREKLKYEIAEELGLMGKVIDGGWKSLTARESGRVGGILAKREKDAREALDG